ncbi:hypothetical protein IOCL1545_000065200 [Leishmania shawi]|uniref:Uncharacterized protein n=1 Tax=Leishmania shawi TaxID=5680 RepID=A0ABR3EHF2_9TRYP
MGGFVVRVNPNGTLGVLLENNRVDLGVPPERIAVTEGVCKPLSHPGYLQVAEWVRSAGLSGADEVEGTACMLYHRGWRAERLCLLEASGTHCMSLMEEAIHGGQVRRHPPRQRRLLRRVFAVWVELQEPPDAPAHLADALCGEDALQGSTSRSVHYRRRGA